MHAKETNSFQFFSKYEDFFVLFTNLKSDYSVVKFQVFIYESNFRHEQNYLYNNVDYRGKGFMQSVIKDQNE